MKEEKTLFEKLYEAGEENLARFAKELLSHPAFSTTMEKALRSATATKGKMDRNIDALFGLLNLPSKTDYNKLLAKVETLQGSLVNLNIKLDRLLAAREKTRKSPRRRTKRSQPPPTPEEWGSTSS
ncbi:MAG: hypothetical protein HYZ72_03775 [Deltaproteobacteria bacterium]|nr:hypothetical protein [Deltaproteobacteria bacterium]